jgi:hypothetical protein
VEEEGIRAAYGRKYERLAALKEKYVANSVVLFENSAIAKALDYVHRKSEQPEENMKISTNAVNLSRCSF